MERKMITNVTEVKKLANHLQFKFSHKWLKLIKTLEHNFDRNEPIGKQLTIPNSRVNVAVYIHNILSFLPPTPRGVTIPFTYSLLPLSIPSVPLPTSSLLVLSFPQLIVNQGSLWHSSDNNNISHLYSQQVLIHNNFSLLFLTHI